MNHILRAVTVCGVAAATAVGCGSQDEPSATEAKTADPTSSTTIATPATAASTTPTTESASASTAPAPSGTDSAPSTTAADDADGTVGTSRNGELPGFEDPLAIDNPYLPFDRRGLWTYEGSKEGRPYRVEVEVTDETNVVAWSDEHGAHETETMVVRHRGWVDDELIEEALDYFAQGDDGGVWYFGEDVDNYDNGEIVDNDGSWRAGVDGALPALLMPAEPAVGQVFYSEDIASQDIIERDEILSVNQSAETPDGIVDNGVLLGATQPDGTEEEKIFVPGVGEVLARSDEGELRLLAWTPQGDGLAYEPDVDPTRFTADVSNAYFPLPIGATWRYEVTTAEGAIDILDVVVTDDTTMVADIETTSVEVTLTVDGETEERTLSWYAQDDAGRVWLFGEIDEGYEEGDLVETTGWEAGVDGAQPGIVMLGDATLDHEYRVGYVAGEMEERGRVLASDATASVPVGDFEGVWVVENWSDLEPDVSERKRYAPGIGLVLVDSDVADTDTVRLVRTSLVDR